MRIMTRVRHALSVLVALAAMLSALGWSNQALASCPMGAVAMSGMHHHGSPVPAKADVGPNCAACLAVLPVVAPVGAEATPRFEPFEIELSFVSGIDPALEPPPPRGV